MSDKIKLGVLGCGPRALQMAAITKLMPERFVLTAMSDPDEKALEKGKAKFSEATFFRSSDDLLDKGGVDAVITEIPPSVHTEYVVKALERNIHVLGEIPAVDSIEEGDLLWKKVQESKAMYMCASNPNYRAKTLFGKKLKEMGLLGKIAYIDTEYMHDMRKFTDQWRKTYESCRYCTHSLGPILALTDGEEFTSVSCMSTYDRIGCGRSHNAMAAILHTQNNIVVRFLTAFALPYKGPAHTTRIITDKGIVELRNESARLWLEGLNDFSAENGFLEIPLTPGGATRPSGLKIIDEELFRYASWGHNGSDIYMMEDFADALLNGKPAPIGIREGLAMTLPGIFAAQSAREGGALKKIVYPWSK
ncbi:MAG: Gfo/Idh/MocA family oxidoreductase [Lentisphaeria bacterium]|nr:Gfo/Idh/MocA family oxidoreductase [Lentisphaeria bacterium]